MYQIFISNYDLRTLTTVVLETFFLVCTLVVYMTICFYLIYFSVFRNTLFANPMQRKACLPVHILYWRNQVVLNTKLPRSGIYRQSTYHGYWRLLEREREQVKAIFWLKSQLKKVSTFILFFCMYFYNLMVPGIWMCQSLFLGKFIEFCFSHRV